MKQAIASKSLRCIRDRLMRSTDTFFELVMIKADLAAIKKALKIEG
jgi:hypothetical protein